MMSPRRQEVRADLHHHTETSEKVRSVGEIHSRISYLGHKLAALLVDKAIPVAYIDNGVLLLEISDPPAQACQYAILSTH